MALKQPDIKNLARRMAMLGIEPETLQKQIQPSLGLGDLSAPSFQAKDIQVADNSPWISGNWGRVGPFTPDAQSRALADAKWKQMQDEQGKAKPNQGPTVAPPNTAATKTSRAVGAKPTLGELMAPRPAAATRSVAPAPVPAAGTPLAPSPQAPIEPFVPINEIPAPMQASGPPEAAGLQNASGPANSGEAKTLAEGTESQKQIMEEFQQSLKAGSPDQGIPGLTNPYAIAAVMATGTHESAFAPANAYGTWNDPSEKGVPGKSGGILSWRDARYEALQNFATRFGDNPDHISPRTQALFTLQEDRNLISKLENSKDAAEAQQYMNQAWAFAGYDKPGGEAADRIATAQKLVPVVQTPDTGMLSSVAPGIPPQQMGDMLSSAGAGNGTFTTADIDPTVSSAVPIPEANPNSIFPPVPDASNMAPIMDPNADKKMALQKLGQLVNSMKRPDLKPPTGTAPAPQMGSYNRDPNALKAIMSMLAGPGGQVIPSLGQLMGGR